MTMNGYHRMSVAEKQAHVTGALAEPPVTCPTCEASVPPSQLLEHMRERCTGRRQPHRLAAWATWTEALAIAPRATLSRWVARGAVRTQGEPGPTRRYLLRDLVLQAARPGRQGVGRRRARRPG